MAKLVQINDYFINPTRVISVVDGEAGHVSIHVDMNEWTATYSVEVEEGGWNKDAIADAINAER